MSLKLYVEGGGDTALLKTACRQGFSELLKKAGLGGRMPRVVACGSRRDAYEAFCTAIGNDQPALLLVDSEAPVAAAHQRDDDYLPWQHLASREGDGWSMPIGASEAQCHLMVQCMESWLIADPVALKQYFGQGFNSKALPATAKGVESIEKPRVFQALAEATKASKHKGGYRKAEHSFQLLARIDPAKVMQASRWARRFFDEVKVRAERNAE